MEGPSKQQSGGRQQNKQGQRGPQPRFVRNSSGQRLDGGDDEVPPGVFHTSPGMQPAPGMQPFKGGVPPSPNRSASARIAPPPGQLSRSSRSPPPSVRSSQSEGRPPAARPEILIRPPGTLPMTEESRHRQRILESEVERLKRELDGLRKHTQDVTRERNRLEEEKQELYKQLKFEQQRLKKVQEVDRIELKRLSGELAYMEKVKGELMKQKKDLEDKIQHANLNAERIDEQQTSLVEQTQGLVSRNAELSTQLHAKTAEVDHLHDMLATLEAELVEVCEDREALAKQLQEAQDFAAQQSRAAAAADEQLRILRSTPPSALDTEEYQSQMSQSSSVSQLYSELADGGDYVPISENEKESDVPLDEAELPNEAELPSEVEVGSDAYELVGSADVSEHLASEDFVRSAGNSVKNLPLLACEGKDPADVVDGTEVPYMPVGDDTDGSPDTSQVESEGNQAGAAGY